jgi:tRNA threonylcarbamoyladenosine biosynthesis protein TsaB
VLIAALDAATLTLSCALLESNEGGVTVLCERTEHAPQKPAAGVTSGHGARLPGVLQELLLSHGARLPELEGYAIGLGPGSFTGLRIGLATWKGLAYANRRPLAGASSLMAMALAAAPDAGEGTLLVPLLDARKGEVYAGFYRRLGPEAVLPLRPDAALSPEALLAALAALPREHPPAAFGEGWAAHEAALSGRLTALATAVRTPGAPAIGRLAAAALRVAPYDTQALSALEPHYARASEAEVKFPNGLPPPQRGPGRP